MGLWNRWRRDSDNFKPGDWDENHPVESGSPPARNPDDWLAWGISMIPFSDVLRLQFTGKLSAGQVAAWFDMSAAESAQTQEIVAWINGGADLAEKLARFDEMGSIIRMVERGMYENQTAVYNALGITTADDR